MASTPKAQGGYDAVFVKPVEKELECPICLFALREPLQTPCGHLMCKSCIDKITLSGGHFKCPLDKTVADRSAVFPDKIHERKVLELKVKCNNLNQGCTWTGQLRELEGHMASECDAAEVICQFCSIGCRHQIKKRDISDHEDKYAKEHIRLLFKNVEDLKAQLRSQPSDSFKFLWRIENWDKTLQNAKIKKPENIYSSSFYSGYPGYKLCLCAYPNGCGTGAGTHAGVYLVVTKGDFDHQLRWPFRHTYKLTVVDQQPDGKDVYKVTDPTRQGAAAVKYFERAMEERSIGWGYHDHITHTELTKRAYIRGNSILIQADIQLH